MARALSVVALLLFAVGANAATIFQYTENDDAGNNVALGYPVPRPLDTSLPGDHFRSYDFLLARHQDIALNNAQVSARIIGSSFKDEDIWAYVLGDADALTAEYGAPEGAVLINGGIHAREWQTPESVSFLLEHLAAIQDDDGVGRYIADNLNVVIIPVLNVDGFRQTQQFWNQVTANEATPRDGRMRRKNMHAATGGTVDADLDTAGDNLHGVDLNRNNAMGFGQNGGSSASPHSLVYHGASAASEPEIEALQAAAALGPAERLRLYQDVHSFTQVYLVPQTGAARRDRYAGDLARKMSAASTAGYGVFLENTGTPIGTTADYFAYTWQVPAWTLELEPGPQGAVQYGSAGVSHDGFILPEDEVGRLHADTLAMHLTGIYLQAGPPAVREVEIVDVETADIRYAARWQHDSAQARHLIVSTDVALVTGREYEFRVIFDKPMVDLDTGRRARANTGRPSAELTFTSIGEDSRVLDALNGGEPEWPEQAGEFHRYRGDTLRLRYRIDAALLAGGNPSRLALAIDAEDFGGAKLDADPATPATWEGGYWQYHESFPGDDGGATAAFGGIDCNYRPFVADSADAEPPAAENGDCVFWNDAQTTSTSGGGRRGGGGALLALLVPLLLTASRRRVA